VIKQKAYPPAEVMLRLLPDKRTNERNSTMPYAKVKVNSVDEYVETQIAPEFHDTVALIRDLMHENAPDAQAAIKWNQPVWQQKAPMVVIGASKTHVLLIFSRGAEFTDTFGLLEGDGGVSKHVKLTNLASLNQDAIRDYIAQAVSLDGVKRGK
jgi:hypothetical protein